MLKKIIRLSIQGLFWVLPLTVIIIIIGWLLAKINLVTHYLFNVFGFYPENFKLIWTLSGFILLIIMLAIIGKVASTKLALTLNSIIKKIPFYGTIKDIINIFNSSKSDKKNTLVVAVKGFTHNDYNIGLMYSTKESIIKNHYTVTLSMSPIPNGGFMFEVHKDNIFVIKNARFSDNLNYMLSMGTKSMAEILNVKPQDNLKSLSQWLENNQQNAQ